MFCFDRGACSVPTCPRPTVAAAYHLRPERLCSRSAQNFSSTQLTVKSRPFFAGPDFNFASSMSRARNVNVTRTHPGSCPLLEASAGLSKLAVPSPSFFRSQLPLSPRNEPQRSVFIVGLRPAIPLPVCPWRLQASPPLSLARSFVRSSFSLNS